MCATHGIFFLFVFLNSWYKKLMLFKKCWCLVMNPCPLLLEATTLPTVPEPLPTLITYWKMWHFWTRVLRPTVPQSLCKLYKDHCQTCFRFCRRHSEYMNPDFTRGPRLPEHLEERTVRFRGVLQQLITEKQFSLDQVRSIFIVLDIFDWL